MLLQAFEEWPIDRSSSFLIGDRRSDIEAARAAGIPGHLFDGTDLRAAVIRITRVLSDLRATCRERR
jgi:D-glycero-D-manno-heptose 1,7-bisphosphate phosphatase